MEPCAKSDGETLSQHIQECLLVAEDIVPTLPLDDYEKYNLLKELKLALALHDVGKAAIGFQKMVKGEEKNWHGWRHEILSASFASAIPNISQAVIFSILTHHRPIPNDGIVEEYKALDFFAIPIGNNPGNMQWTKMRSQWLDNYPSFKESWIKICQMIGRNDIQDISSLASLRLDPDWLERDIWTGQLARKTYSERRSFSILRGLLMACDHMASAHYRLKPHIFSDLDSSLNLFHHSEIPRHFQTVMSETEGSVILRAPTGSGKTEASLLWAKRNNRHFSRIYYVLPNIASINAMYYRLKSHFSEDCVGLLHSRASTAIYRILESGEDLESKLKDQRNAKMISDLSRTIWFPVRVCTPHQILRFSLRGRGWEPMLVEFPNALFVFDEIHSYDPTLVGQILATAKMVSSWGARCAFLSATMPTFLIELIKTKIEDANSSKTTKIKCVFPDPIQDREILNKCRHFLHIEDGNILNSFPKILQDMREGRKVLIVCNSVRISQRVFEELREISKQDHSIRKDTTILLLHSRFTHEDRREKELRVMDKSGRPSVLVATQVVEVSLDISYDVAYLEPAPIDAIIQRMGRVNRKGEAAPALVHIMSEEASKHSIYRNKERVKNSMTGLFELSNKPITEMDMVDVANRIYAPGYNEEEWRLFLKGYENPELMNFERELLAGASKDWKEQVLSDLGGVDVLPLSLLDEFERRANNKLFIEAYNLLVPIQFWSLSKLDVDKKHDPWIVNAKYSHLTGLAVDPSDQEDDMVASLPPTPGNIIP